MQEVPNQVTNVDVTSIENIKSAYGGEHSLNILMNV